MLTIKRFQVLAESYGADLQRWPQESRTEAERLLAVSSEARQALAAARILDAAILEASTQDQLSPAEQSAALERLKSAVASRTCNFKRAAYGRVLLRMDAEMAS